MDKKTINTRKILISLGWVTCLAVGLLLGLKITKQMGNEAHKALDDIARQLPGAEKTRREKMTGITDYMSTVAAAVAVYHEREDLFPPSLYSTEDIKTTLGVSVSAKKISSITVTSLGPEEITITAIITGVDSETDGRTCTLTGRPSKHDGLVWTWGGTVPSLYLPK